MKLNKQALALLVALAVVIVGSVFAVSAAQPGDAGQAAAPGDDCGDLRLDEQYACRYGGWEPAPPAGDEAVDRCIEAECGETFRNIMNDTVGDNYSARDAIGGNIGDTGLERLEEFRAVRPRARRRRINDTQFGVG